jgi:hypothetical protein
LSLNGEFDAGRVDLLRQKHKKTQLILLYIILVAAYGNQLHYPTNI